MKRLLSATLDVNIAKIVEVESSFNRGLPAFSIVGLANSAILESKDRVKSALLSNSYTFPPLKITINLSPSDIKKNGSHFDLAIALSIALQQANVDLNNFFIFGELGLDGRVKETNSIFPLILSLSKDNICENFIVPKESVFKLSQIPNIKLYGVETLNEAIDLILNQDSFMANPSHELEYKSIDINGEKYYYLDEFLTDFKDIKGQESAKRGAIISASGMHNLMLEGSPGCGKSMIAKRLQYILPPLSKDEILENAKLLALDGKEIDFKPIRNFRSPHHSSTKSSIFGGGSKEAKIGEVALSHNGILFFDEIPHFPKDILEALREPLEDNRLNISRVNSKVTYDTSFLFVSALNPCPCGNMLSKNRECRCSDIEIKRYKNRLSDPLLDRIDIFVQMDEISSNDKSSISSKEAFELVLKSFKAQKIRGQTNLNGKMSDEEIREFCKLNIETKNILDKAIDRFSLSFRAMNKILKVSRTVADINGNIDIQKGDILEALNFRKR